ncbi:MAG TPA: zinc-ribbon domain containing protein [Oscillospiraceae bacterium]|nr:zinc-ribbon domain containing protein [Oscillospiraceae bacterium]HPS34378.1 zinc-ribbon domain containing protein [Oscillospiraceae bacterium]
MYKDKILTCKDCGQQFTFTASEQEFHAEKGFTNEPQRCKACRSARKASTGGGNGAGPRKMYDAVCAECGKSCKVPFEPRSDRPVYCSDCFRKQ